MIQELPDISFERNMNHNYLILKKCNFFDTGKNTDTDFRIRMILENTIPGLLPVSHRMVNGESRYYYEINSLQSLDRLYQKKEIKYEELKALLSGCIKLFDRLEEYLLDGTQIIIKSEFIYINVENMEPYFVCYPDYTGDVRLSFMEFIDDILTRIDHTDQRAVMLGYQIYRYTRNQNYVLSEISSMMNHTIVSMAENNNVSSNVSDLKSEQQSSKADKWMFNKALSESDSNHLDNSITKNENDSDTEYKNNKSIKYDPMIYEAIHDDYDESVHTDKVAGIAKCKGISDLIGAILCVFIALSAAAIVLGARILMLFKLSGKQELYLYGAIAMALMAAVLFLSCFIKKRRHEKEIEALECDEDYMEIDYKKEFTSEKPLNTASNIEKISENKKISKAGIMENGLYEDKYNYCNNQNQYSGETICLGSSVVEERMLRGRMDGKEISISLNQLPVTVGKLASFVDYVINDNAVSKMHARFEEHDGKVYLCDLNSTNGTVKNGTLIGINNPVPLEPGDKLRFGRTCFTYC